MRPSRKAPMVRSSSLKWLWSSSSTRCQSISRLGPSIYPSSDTCRARMIFRMGRAYARGACWGNGSAARGVPSSKIGNMPPVWSAGATAPTVFDGFGSILPKRHNSGTIGGVFRPNRQYDAGQRWRTRLEGECSGRCGSDCRGDPPEPQGGGADAGGPGTPGRDVRAHRSRDRDRDRQPLAAGCGGRGECAGPEARGGLMPAELQDLRFIRSADVYKNGLLAGQLARTGQGGVRFSYRADYLAGGHPSVAVSLPLSEAAVEAAGGALPAFFAGLLPEGHRLTVLKNATKTS